MLIFQNFKTTTLQPKQPQLYSTHRSLAQDGDVRGFKHTLGEITATVSELLGTIFTFVFLMILLYDVSCMSDECTVKISGEAERRALFGRSHYHFITEFS